jgi:hypothetical protein
MSSWLDLEFSCWKVVELWTLRLYRSFYNLEKWSVSKVHGIMCHLMWIKMHKFILFRDNAGSIKCDHFSDDLWLHKIWKLPGLKLGPESPPFLHGWSSTLHKNVTETTIWYYTLPSEAHMVEGYNCPSPHIHTAQLHLMLPNTATRTTKTKGRWKNCLYYYRNLSDLKQTVTN